jgi:hypothetical protein
MRPMLEVSTDYGYSVAIHENDLTSLIDEQLKLLRISRAELRRCFAEGVKLMQGKTESDRVRPCADEIRDGKWNVNLVQYSKRGGPVLKGRQTLPSHISVKP